MVCERMGACECVRGCVAGSGTRSRHLAGLVDLPGCYPECARAQWPHGQARIVQDKRCAAGGVGRGGVWRLPALRKMPGHWICRSQKLSFT